MRKIFTRAHNYGQELAVVVETDFAQVNDDIGLYHTLLARGGSSVLLYTRAKAPQSTRKTICFGERLCLQLVRHSSAIVERRLTSAPVTRLFGVKFPVRLQLNEVVDNGVIIGRPGGGQTQVQASSRQCRWHMVIIVCGDAPDWFRAGEENLQKGAVVVFAGLGRGCANMIAEQRQRFLEQEENGASSATVSTSRQESVSTKLYEKENTAVVLVFPEFLFDVRFGLPQIQAHAALTLQPACPSSIMTPKNSTRSGFVAFSPIVNSDAERIETCRRVRKQYWKAVYYRSGSQQFARHCGAGSALRVYSRDLFLRLVADDDALPKLDTNADEKYTSKILTHLDLALSDQRPGLDYVSIYASNNPVPEDGWYVQKPALHAATADHFQVEAVTSVDTAASYHENDVVDGGSGSGSNAYTPVAPFVQCMPGLNWFQINTRGVIGSYCFRQQVERHFRYFVSWWVNGMGNQAVPEEGSLLALWRNGEVGQFPWDSDFDLKLYTADPSLTKDEFHEQLKKQFAKDGETDEGRTTQAWSFLGCGDDNYFLIRIPNITHHIGDVYYQNNVKRTAHPWRVRMLGSSWRSRERSTPAKALNLARNSNRRTGSSASEQLATTSSDVVVDQQQQHATDLGFPISVSQGHMEHIFFDRYHGPVEKLYGDHGSPLQCQSRNHNACLPDCKKSYTTTTGGDTEDDLHQVEEKHNERDENVISKILTSKGIGRNKLSERTSSKNTVSQEVKGVSTIDSRADKDSNAGAQRRPGCDFDDNFVHLDVWDVPENDPFYWPSTRNYEEPSPQLYLDPILKACSPATDHRGWCPR
ncbi:unnamed protein product [Amoebophrya sp. A25]|nr:unnamed protein product [Amoebophrya sp. A25]|eukprot:GSA25T00023296001.1